MSELMAGTQRATACDDAPYCSESTAIAHRRQGAWHIVVSENFQICSLRDEPEARRAAQNCEEIRRRLIAAWQLQPDAAAWIPKCQVILHGSLNRYLAAVGKGQEATLGSSLVQPTRGVVTSRRIDLRSDSNDSLDAVLPHELCHVLLADRFRDDLAPLWYDEGLALLADTPAKQWLHDRDLREGMRRGVEFPLSELLAANRYPTGERLAVFYGQSASLTRFLVAYRPPENLHRFIEKSRRIGINPAMRECYGVAGLSELERRWRQSLELNTGAPAPAALPAVGIKSLGIRRDFVLVAE